MAITLPLGGLGFMDFIQGRRLAEEDNWRDVFNTEKAAQQQMATDFQSAIQPNAIGATQNIYDYQGGQARRRNALGDAAQPGLMAETSGLSNIAQEAWNAYGPEAQRTEGQGIAAARQLAQAYRDADTVANRIRLEGIDPIAVGTNAASRFNADDRYNTGASTFRTEMQPFRQMTERLGVMGDLSTQPYTQAYRAQQAEAQLRGAQQLQRDETLSSPGFTSLVNAIGSGQGTQADWDRLNSTLVSLGVAPITNQDTTAWAGIEQLVNDANSAMMARFAIQNPNAFARLQGGTTGARGGAAPTQAPFFMPQGASTTSPVTPTALPQTTAPVSSATQPTLAQAIAPTPEPQFTFPSLVSDQSLPEDIRAQIDLANYQQAVADQNAWQQQRANQAISEVAQGLRAEDVAQWRAQRQQARASFDNAVAQAGELLASLSAEQQETLAEQWAEVMTPAEILQYLPLSSAAEQARLSSSFGG